MSKSSKTLIAAAITALLAVPAAHAVDDSFYATTDNSSAKFSGSGCKTANIKKQNATLEVDDTFFEGGGDNTGEFYFTMYVFGDTVDGDGPLVASNKGRTLNMDLTGLGQSQLSSAFGSYMDGNFPDNDGCEKAVVYNEDMVITKFETKLNKKNTKAKLKMDAEATYENDKGKDKKVKLKVKANMDGGAVN